jgi:hypothetical protein
MSPDYYGSRFANDAVRAYRAWCRANGYVCDEPGAGGVLITLWPGGRLMAEISTQDGHVFRCVRLPNGRVLEVGPAAVAPRPSVRGNTGAGRAAARMP